jgi:ribosomal-protein-alanine N-acetyltransferase
MMLFETPRLTFRPLIVDDVGDLAAIYADPEVMRFFPERYQDPSRAHEHAVQSIERAQRAYAHTGLSFWATVHKADSRFIGRCGLLSQVLDGRQEFEVAYLIARSHWGLGLGTEAARAIKGWGFETRGPQRLVSIIAPNNRASIRVAEKNGMHYERDVLFEGYVDRLYVVSRNGS